MVARFALTNPRYSASLARHLGVRRQPLSAFWWFYADGFQRGDVEMGDEGYLAARLDQFNPTFLYVDSVFLARAATRVEPDVAVPGPTMLSLSGAIAVGLLWLRRRRPS